MEVEFLINALRGLAEKGATLLKHAPWESLRQEGAQLLEEGWKAFFGPLLSDAKAKAEVRRAVHRLFTEWLTPEKLLAAITKFERLYSDHEPATPKVDEFGFDLAYVDSIRPFFQFLYERYWRVSVSGVSHLPPTKQRALLVANHSGTLPYDGAMVNLAVFNNHRHKRRVRFLVENFVYYLPFVGTFISRIGGVRGSPENAERLLKQNHLVVVFPEGVKGIGKLYCDRYRLQRFGRGGFVRLAIRTKSPIIPTAVIGAEEIHPTLWKSDILAKPFGFPYLPVTPTFPWLGPLGLIPLPSKWQIHFGPPMTFEKYRPKDAEDDWLVYQLSQKVRAKIQAMIDHALARRKSIWL